MREPDWDIEGWTLRNGEEAHSAAPDTFWIPSLSERASLKVGDYAKLIFEISVDDPEDPVSVERMWVIVRERIGGRYLGRPDNEPDALAPNDEFWVGTEVPFGPEHIINIEPGDDASIALAVEAPLKSWPRE